MLGDVYASEDMERYGAVAKVLPDRDARTTHVGEVAEKLADRAPVALQRIKANLNDADTRGFPEELKNNDAERHPKFSWVTLTKTQFNSV